MSDRDLKKAQYYQLKEKSSRFVIDSLINLVGCGIIRFHLELDHYSFYFCSSASSSFVDLQTISKYLCHSDSDF